MRKNRRESGFTAGLAKEKETRSRTVVVRLSNSLHKRLKAAAEKSGVSMSAFVRVAIIDGIERVE